MRPSRKAARYVCPASGGTWPLDVPLWRSPDGTPLMLSEGDGLAPDEIELDCRSPWRYAAALRLDAGAALTLGEGWTPLLETAWPGGTVRFKAEYLAPSGSFKDRGTAVMVSYLRACGVDRILEDSSGNAGASIATYAAAAGLSCRILVPATASAGKIAQMRACGADVAAIPGTRQDVADAALAEAERTFYASHNWQPFFLEGTKTLAFEIWEQLGFRAPDAIVVPYGYGSNVLGCDIGFRELLRHGRIDRLPRLYAVQAANCAPLHAAFEAGADGPVDCEIRPTLAEGIASAKPVRLRAALDALRRSGGGTVAVTEAEIAPGLTALARRGFFVEPTGATVAPALDRLFADGRIREKETVVAVLTGSGLKATDAVTSLLGAAPTAPG